MATTIDEILSREYAFYVIAEPEGGYTIVFPDLPGCVTQAETIDDVVPMAMEARNLWLESEYDRQREIPLPTYPETLSGKFNVRLPKSLHRDLARRAEEENISLNQLVVYLLARGIGANAGSHTDSILTRSTSERMAS